MNQATNQDIIDILKSMDLETDVDLQSIDPDMNFSDIGLDSLDIMDFYFKLEESYGVKITDQEIENREWDSISKVVKKIIGR